MSMFEIEELTVEELNALPDLIAELALGCGYIFCGGCHPDKLT